MKIAPSIMCSKPWDVATYIKKFEETGVHLIHYDVMDGNYVPNISIGTGMYAAIHEISNIPIDLHLMVQNPDVAVDYFNILAGDHVSFHPETAEKPDVLLKRILSKGAYAGIALSPKVSLDYVGQLIEFLDFVLIMTVEPGFAGQRMIPECVDKVAELSKMREKNSWGFEIFVDGDCSPRNARKVIEAGANGCVIGSALINPNNKAENFDNTLADYMKEYLA